MKQQSLKRCPIGIQTFEEIINKDYLYIDKTEYVYRMAYGTAILPERKTFSRDLPSKSWKPSGRNTRCFTLT